MKVEIRVLQAELLVGAAVMVGEEENGCESEDEKGETFA